MGHTRYGSRMVALLVLALAAAPACETTPLEPDPDAGVDADAGLPDAVPPDGPTPDRNPPAAFAWVAQGGGANGDIADDLALDSAGNIYIVGAFSGSATFGATTLTAGSMVGGGARVFVAKLDPSGKILWAVSADGVGGHAIAVDSAGNSTITGTLMVGISSFGDTTLVSPFIQGFAARLDPDGVFLWAVATPVTGYNSVAVDGSGNTVIAGSFEVTRTLGPSTLVSKGETDGFVAKLDKDGTYLWAVRAGGTGRDGFDAVAVDSNGNIHVTGDFQSTTADFGALTLSNPFGDPVSVVARLNPQGEFQWVSRLLASDQRGGSNALVVDGAGNSFVAGSLIRAPSGPGDCNTEVLVVKLDPNGTEAWTTTTTTTLQTLCTTVNVGQDIALGPGGKIYVTGTYGNTVGFDGISLTSTNQLSHPVMGSHDMFVAGLDGSGKFIWAYSAGGVGNDEGCTIGVDPAGNAYVAGYFLDTVDFGPRTLTCQGPNAGPDIEQGDVYVLKVAP